MNKRKLVVASANEGKLKEFAQILNGFEIVGYRELGITEDIEETGSTFYENALIKAKTISERLHLPAISDDSGLVVEALNGEPGIYSARYAGDGDNEHNIDLLLKNMQGRTNRNAKFVSCIVYYDNGKITTAVGETLGEIAEERQGKNGFGYDPVFISKDLNKSFGECSSEEKNSVSHRARALLKMKELLGDKI